MSFGVCVTRIHLTLTAAGPVPDQALRERITRFNATQRIERGILISHATSILIIQQRCFAEQIARIIHVESHAALKTFSEKPPHRNNFPSPHLPHFLGSLPAIQDSFFCFLAVLRLFHEFMIFSNELQQKRGVFPEFGEDSRGMRHGCSGGNL